tara:strand:+ start:335 stop:1153 length:819 start_codon:yes stop_codon:yes gene_type:complete
MPRYTPTEEIDVFATGGSVGDQYLKMMQGNASAPATMQDYQAEADRLSFLLPQTRKPSIYDMASDLSQGLAQQAASGKPASVGYGLAAGFNLFSENSEKLREKRKAAQQTLMTMAYQDVEKKRAEQKAMRSTAMDYDFKMRLEQMKKTGELFGGTNNDASAWNYILSKIDPATNDWKMVPDGKGGVMKYDPSTDPHYSVAKANLEQSKTEVRNVPGQGQVQIQTPGYNVSGALNLNEGATSTPAIGFIKNWNGVDYEFNGGDPNIINNWVKI